MSKVGERLIASATEARAIAKGQLAPAGVYVPPEVDIKAIRQELERSQEDFAAEFGFSINQIRDWEQGRSRPTGAARAYLMIIREEPQLVRDLLRRTKHAA